MENINFEIKNVERHATSGCIMRIYYTASLTRDGVTVKQDGFAGLKFKDSSDDDFINFESIDRATLENWLDEYMAQGENERISGDLEYLLNVKLNPSTQFGLPPGIA